MKVVYTMDKTKTIMDKPNKTVITYGTFDLFHIGHLRLLKRAKSLGDKLIVAVSTDEFNLGKGKKCVISYENRAEIVSAIECVDLVIPEVSWEQKITDVKTHDVDIFVMGDDWQGKFDYMQEHCKVSYLPRTNNISTTDVKQILSRISQDDINNLKDCLSVMSNIMNSIQ